jgi:hypothetical protein
MRYALAMRDALCGTLCDVRCALSGKWKGAIAQLGVSASGLLTPQAKKKSMAKRPQRRAQHAARACERERERGAANQAPARGGGAAAAAYIT